VPCEISNKDIFCRDNNDCPDTVVPNLTGLASPPEFRQNYCLLPSDTCNGKGVARCSERPQVKCTKECNITPVIGCDGKEYCNSCIALSQGIIAQTPAPVTDPSPSPIVDPVYPCPGCFGTVDIADVDPEILTSLASVVDNNDYILSAKCQVVAGQKCTFTLFSGKCVSVFHPLPGSGLTTKADVVPCDGTAPAPTKGCKTNAECGATEYCSLNPGLCSGDGVCVVKPEVCPMYCMETKLKGCNGEMYCNPCEANSAGTVVADTSRSIFKLVEATKPKVTNGSPSVVSLSIVSTLCLSSLAVLFSML
jgi:hypothetical protein